MTGSAQPKPGYTVQTGLQKDERRTTNEHEFT